MAKYTNDQFKKAVEGAVKDHGGLLHKVISVSIDGATALIKHTSSSGKQRQLTRFQLMDDGKVGYSKGFLGQLNTMAFAKEIAAKLKDLK